MRKLFKIFILGPLFIGSLIARAGTIQITGNGEASSPPDMYHMDIKVISICYESTQEAKNENAKIANNLIKLSQKFLRDSNDKVTTYPGGFIRDTEYIPGDDGHSKTLCERKWKTWNTVRLTLHDLKSLPAVQDEILTYLAPIEALQPNKKEQSFVQLSSPEFSLTDENRTKLRRQAQQAALQDAKDQFLNFDANCHFKSAKLNSLTPPSFSSVLRYASKAAETSDSATPVIPENITVTATWNFIWEFDSTPGCYT